MNIKHAIKALCKSNPVTGAIYRKIAYARADQRELQGVIRPIRKAMRERPDAVFLVMTPEHGNLGDHAIAIAEMEMLRNMGISYIELTYKMLSVLKRNDCLNLLNGRTILVHGGGYLGTIWFSAEQLLREIIQCNTKSKILCMPNTFFYENNDWGKQEQENSVAIYNAHPRLKLYARERISYDQMKPIYKDVRLTPDMVMSLNRCRTDAVRKACLLCLRGDCEKTRTPEQEQIVVAQAEALFPNAVGYTDMVVDHGISPVDRERELEAQFQAFRSAELVITDRLHGMIFCAITGTPCIVINSKSHKVRGCYEWIKHLDYVRFCDDLQNIGEIYREIPKGVHRYDADHLTPYYDTLKSDILEASRR